MGLLRDYLNGEALPRYYCPGCDRTFDTPHEAYSGGWRPYGGGYAYEDLRVEVCPFCSDDLFFPWVPHFRLVVAGRLRDIPTIKMKGE